MRKVLFLMFLLLLIGLGAASVKAQVRIGGNTAPSAAAVLDLNATDAANTGTGGLVLPRVNLTSNTMQLTTGVANVIGTMVYDVTASLGQIGGYYWNGNSWVKASLPPLNSADSGRVLKETPDGLAWSLLFDVNATLLTATLNASGSVTSWTRHDYAVPLPNTVAGERYAIESVGTQGNDICIRTFGMDAGWLTPMTNLTYYYAFFSQPAHTATFSCFRAN